MGIQQEKGRRKRKEGERRRLDGINRTLREDAKKIERGIEDLMLLAITTMIMKNFILNTIPLLPPPPPPLPRPPPGLRMGLEEGHQRSPFPPAQTQTVSEQP